MGQDVEGFIAWLREQGLPEEHLAAYRGYITEIGRHPSLSAALRSFEEEGRTPRQIANMRQVAARFAEFEQRDTAARAPALPETAKKPPPEPVLDVEPKRPTASATPARLAMPVSSTRRGCSCRTRYDVYLDNDFGALARLLGGGVGIGTFILIRLVGVLGALTLAFGLAGIGGLATIISICYRCEGCRQRVTDLDVDERAHLRKGRAMVVLVTAGLIAAAAVCGYLWMAAVKARNHM